MKLRLICRYKDVNLEVPDDINLVDLARQIREAGRAQGRPLEGPIMMTQREFVALLERGIEVTKEHDHVEE